MACLLSYQYQEVLFMQKKIKYVDFDEIQKHIKYCFDYREIVFRAKEDNETFGIKAFIEDNLVYFKISYRYASHPCTYVFRKDGVTQEKITGSEAFRILSKYYKVPRVDTEICGRYEDGGLSASPLLYSNPKYENQRVEAIGYDLNSAYSSAMLQPIPDTSVQPKSKIIEEGKEIGFKEIEMNGRMSLTPIFKGYSIYVFPLMQSPFTKFVNTWYNKKKNAKNQAEKDKAKCVLNFCVGYMQLVNPFIRATIIGRCNDLIKSLMNEDTLYCNTDCIVSLKERNDLSIGNEIGQFKIEHKGLFAYKGLTYQWDYDLPSYRGICKSWFSKGWDLLKDSIPNNGNVYRFNKEIGKMERINYEIKSKTK